MFHGNPYDNTNYYRYGQPVYAPADGVVRSIRNDVPDNKFEVRDIRYPHIPPRVDEDLGNVVVIDHRDGEFSVLPHMRMGTVRMKAGDNEGVPAYFDNLNRLVGDKRIHVDHTPLDTGDIVEFTLSRK